MAKVIEVIEVQTSKGNGKDIPVRTVTEYWTKEGELLAINEPHLYSIEDLINIFGDRQLVIDTLLISSKNG